MSAATLEAALRELGVRCTVEGRDRLAVLVADDADASRDAARMRNDTLRLMRAHGFTNLALEVAAASADHAPLHRD